MQLVLFIALIALLSGLPNTSSAQDVPPPIMYGPNGIPLVPGMPIPKGAYYYDSYGNKVPISDSTQFKSGRQQPTRPIPRTGTNSLGHPKGPLPMNKDALNKRPAMGLTFPMPDMAVGPNRTGSVQQHNPLTNPLPPGITAKPGTIHMLGQPKGPLPMNKDALNKRPAMAPTFPMPGMAVGPNRTGSVQQHNPLMPGVPAKPSQVFTPQSQPPVTLQNKVPMKQRSQPIGPGISSWTSQKRTSERKRLQALLNKLEAKKDVRVHRMIYKMKNGKTYEHPQTDDLPAFDHPGVDTVSPRSYLRRSDAIKAIKKSLKTIKAYER